MNKFLTLILFSFSIAQASVENKVIIYGKIGSAFTKTHVKIIDQHKQTYFLEKSIFPKNFKFVKDATFSLEVTEDLFNKALKDQ